MKSAVFAIELCLASVLLQSALVEGCICALKSGYSCSSTPGCYWRGKVCSGICGGDNIDWNCIDNPDITYCDGPATEESVCSDRVADWNSTTSILTPDFLCQGTDFFCNWDEDTEQCVLDGGACDSTLLRIGQGDCERLGCEWSEEPNPGCTSTSGAPRSKGVHGSVYPAVLVGMVAFGIFILK